LTKAALASFLASVVAIPQILIVHRYYI